MGRRETMACLGFSVDVRAVAQEDAHDLELVGARGQVQGRLAALRDRVGRGAARLEEQEHDVLVAHEGGHVQRGEARLGGRLQVRLEAEQQLDHLDAVLLARHVQRREAVLRERTGFGSA